MKRTVVKWRPLVASIAGLGILLGQTDPPSVEHLPAVAVVFFQAQARRPLITLAAEPYRVQPPIGPATKCFRAQADGASSALRISGAEVEEFRFLFEVGNRNGTELYRLTVKKAAREFLLASKPGATCPGSVPSDFVALGHAVTQLVPRSRLESGEYGVFLSGKTLFTFGVDR